MSTCLFSVLNLPALSPVLGWKELSRVSLRPGNSFS